jgi:hypothetical protein
MGAPFTANNCKKDVLSELQLKAKRKKVGAIRNHAIQRQRVSRAQYKTFHLMLSYILFYVGTYRHDGVAAISSTQQDTQIPLSSTKILPTYLMFAIMAVTPHTCSGTHVQGPFNTSLEKRRFACLCSKWNIKVSARNGRLAKTLEDERE